MEITEKPHSFRKRAWALIRPYWKSEERWLARGLLAIIVTLSLGDVYLKVLFNKWNNDFYNALQAYDKTAFVHLLIRFSYLALISIVVNVYNTYFARMLHIKWRRWMTSRYLSRWLEKQNYYRMQIFGGVMDNPDQRISEDIDQFVRLTLDLSLGALSSVVTLFSFLAILWTLSGALDFALGGMAVHIPGYMVWVALLYAFLGTWLTFRIGKPLSLLNYNQQRYEADFRYSMVRLRENSESIAFYKGESIEHKGFVTRFSAIVENWWKIMRRQKKLNWFTNGYNQIANVFPFLVIAPRYFAKEIQLGGLMQTADAFGYVQGALSYLINAFTIDSTTGIVNWKAVADRLNGFNDSILHAEVMQKPASGFTRELTQGNSINAQEISIHLPDGEPLLQHISLSLKPADTLLITGRSGAGKSTLLRALAGLWPFVSGKLEVPDSARILFVPQKPYLPLGTLRQALYYPQMPDSAEAELREVLSLCGLEGMGAGLDATDQWSNVLSLGEQQRVAFARVLLAKPDYVFLDEATSALDEASEAQLYGMLKQRLPNAAIVSVGHRASLRAFHATEVTLG